MLTKLNAHRYQEVKSKIQTGIRDQISEKVQRQSDYHVMKQHSKHPSRPVSRQLISRIWQQLKLDISKC